MCIRDRDSGDSHSRDRQRSTVGLQVAGHAVGLSGDAHSDCCLLYTSDAADERSSVDLGGRRIIKKKKHDVLNGVRAA